MWRTTPTLTDQRSPLPEDSSLPPAGGAHPAPDPAPASTPGSVVVPDLVGMHLHDAREDARLAELELVADERPSDRAFRGRIIRQEPQPGASVRPGEAVRVVVGARPGVLVPDVRGLDEHESVAILQAARLFPSRRVVRRSGSVPQGQIIRTRPRSGTEVPVGTRVTLVVAAAPRPRASSVRQDRRSRSRRSVDAGFSYPEGG